MPEVRLREVPAGFCAGLVHASGVQPGESPAELQQLAQRVSREAVDAGLGGGEARRAAIRTLLRQGGYRPAGATSLRRNTCSARSNSRAFCPRS